MSRGGTVRKVLLTQPDDPSYVPVPLVPITRHQKAWRQAMDEGVIRWDGGMFPSRIDSCAVPGDCKPQKPKFTTEFGDNLKHGDILKFTKKFNGWSCFLRVGRDDDGLPVVVVTGRFNGETPFTYYMPFKDCFREWAADVSPEFWAELVAYGPNGEQLGYEAVSSVMAYLKRTPNPPADAPYLCVVLFAFRFAEWNRVTDSEFATQFSGDMLASLQEEERLLKAFVRQSRSIQVVEGTYYIVDRPSDGSIRLSDLSNGSVRFDSWDEFIVAMDERSITGVWEGYVLSKQRTIFDCPGGEPAWKRDCYGMYRDNFSVKRRPGNEPELWLLCTKFELKDGQRIFALYGQIAGTLVHCGFLDIKVCSKEIRSKLLDLSHINQSGFGIDIKSRETFSALDALKKIPGKHVNWILDNCYLIKCVPTWISWKNQKVSGIKFVDCGLSPDDCDLDLSETISNLMRIAASIPYMNEIHKNTAAILRLITELERPVRHVACGGGAAPAVMEDEAASSASVAHDQPVSTPAPLPLATSSAMDFRVESYCVYDIRQRIANFYAVAFDKAIGFFRPMCLKVAVDALARHLQDLEGFLTSNMRGEFEYYTDSEFESIKTSLEALDKDTVACLTCVFSTVHTRRYAQSRLQFTELATILASKFLSDGGEGAAKRHKVGND